MIYTYRYIKKKKQEKAERQNQLQSVGSQDRPTSVFHATTSQDRSSLGNAPSSHLLNDPAEPHGEDVECGKCQDCKRRKRERRKYRMKLMLGLSPPFLLATLDLTVVATSLPFIALHFNKFDQLNWIVNSYTLTSTAFIPAFGQLADVFGRHSTLQFSMFLMLVGSVLCAAAQTWGMLLFGRALQGMSAAGIKSIITIVLADKASLKENAKNTSIFQFIGGTSYGYGPVIGGYLTNANWRYCFVISIPIAVLAHVLIFFLLRKDLVKGRYSARKSFFAGLATVDLGGTILFVCAVCLIILATTWGGATYSWNSAPVISTLTIGSTLFIAFWVYEYLLEPGRFLGNRFSRQTAMVPFSLFGKKDVVLVAILQFGAGAAFYSIFYFVSIYFTLGEGYDAGKAGVQLLYYIPGLGVGVYMAMFMCNVYPASTYLPLVLGSVIETTGVGLIVHAVQTRSNAIMAGMMALAGVGTGMRFMPATLHISGMWPSRLAPALSLMGFALPFGGTLSLAIMGSVFNNKFAGLQVSGSISGNLNSDSQGLDEIAQLSPDQQDIIRSQGRYSVKWAFISIIPILVIATITSFFLGNVWIKRRLSKSHTKTSTDAPEAQAPTTEPAASTGTSMVIYESYMLAKLRGTKYVDSKREVTVPLKHEGPEIQNIPMEEISESNHV